VSRNTNGLRRGGPGRPKGTQNRATTDARTACARIVNDRAYRKNLLERARAGELAPAVEVALWQYAFGKPKNLLEFTGGAGSAIVVVTGVPRIEGLDGDVHEG